MHAAMIVTLKYCNCCTYPLQVALLQRSVHRRTIPKQISPSIAVNLYTIPKQTLGIFTSLYSTEVCNPSHRLTTDISQSIYPSIILFYRSLALLHRLHRSWTRALGYKPHETQTHTQREHADLYGFRRRVSPPFSRTWVSR